MNGLETWIELANNPLAILVVIIATGARGIWVFGWIYRERVGDLDQRLTQAWEEAAAWRAVAEQGTTITDHAIKRGT